MDKRSLKVLATAFVKPTDIIIVSPQIHLHFYWGCEVVQSLSMGTETIILIFLKWGIDCKGHDRLMY